MSVIFFFLIKMEHEKRRQQLYQKNKSMKNIQIQQIDGLYMIHSILSNYHFGIHYIVFMIDHQGNGTLNLTQLEESSNQQNSLFTQEKYRYGTIEDNKQIKKQDKKDQLIRSVILFNERFDYISDTKRIHETNPNKIEYYLASGHITNFRFKGQKVYKKAKPRQIDFYNNNPHEQLFNPKFFGIEDQQIVLQNLLDGMILPSVIDIKLGKPHNKFKTNSLHKQKTLEKRSSFSSMNTLGFRITGYATSESKQFGLLVKDQIINKWLLSKVITQRNRSQVLGFLSSLSEHLKSHNRIYQATSILIISDSNQTKVKWIDFTYWDESQHPDYGLLEGLSHLQRLIKELY